MCKHDIPAPEASSNGFFTHKIPVKVEDRLEWKEIHLPERPPPDVPRISGNYDVVLPYATRSGVKSTPKDKPGNISIRRMYGKDARLLSTCWDIATTHTFNEIFEKIFTLLSGKIYTRAFTYRLGPPPPEYEEEASRIETKRKKAEERRKDFCGDYPGEMFYHY